MAMKTAVAAIAVAAGLIATRSYSQNADKAGPAQMGGMMSGNMMSMMSQMGQMMHQSMMGQSEASKLVDQLATSFAAIESEKDPAALRAKLAAHGALIKQLQAKTQAQSNMMGNMQHMMGTGAQSGK